MKQFRKLIVFGLVLGMFFSGLGNAQASPPPLPSGFYGEIHFIEGDGGPGEGDTIEAYVPGAETAVAQAVITTYETNLVYTIRVPGDDTGTTDVVEGGTEGGEVTFKIGTRVVAVGTWYSGTNVNLNIHPPKAIAGGPYTGTVGVEIQLSGSAQDLGGDLSAYAWDLDNDGAYDDTSDQNPTTTFSTAGQKNIGLKVTDSQGGQGFASTTVDVAKATAIVTLGNLNHTYDGTPKGATAVTDPEGLQVTFTYDGDEIEPTDAGSYTVVATVADDNYQGSDEGQLVINPASASISISNLDQDYDGDPKPVTVTTNPEDLVTYTVTYNGESTAPTDTGAYAVVATITDPNYTGDPASGTLVIRATHSMILVPGWNLVSFNLQPYPSTAPSDVLSSITGSYDLVYAWDASGGHSASGHWMSYDTIEPTTDTLTDINEALGLWIHITAAESQTLNVKGFMPNQTSIDLLTGSGGWNLVGFPASISNTPTSAFSGVENLSLVYEYDPTISGDEWKIYDPAAPNYANDLETIRPGFGYWVFVTDPDTWNVLY